MSGTERPARIELMDALRGLAVCLMVLHHFLYDLCEFLGAPWWLFTNPVFDVLHYFFAGLFIFLSGISSDFSRSNLKRGAKAMALALGITLFPAAAVVLCVPARHLGRALCQGGPPAAVVLHSQSAAPRPRRASRACPLRSASALALCAHHAAPAHSCPIGGPRCTTERSKTATLPTARASA